MKSFPIIAALSLAVIIGMACVYSIASTYNATGTYIGQNANQAFMVQIVEGSGGVLTGLFEETDLKPDGDVTETRLPLTGTKDGDQLAVVLTPGEMESFFVGNISLAGSVNGSTLALQGGSADFNANLSLQRGDATTYDGWSSSLRNQSAAILAAKAAYAQQQREIAAQKEADEAAHAQRQREIEAQKEAEQQAAIEAENAAAAKAQAAKTLEQEIADELRLANAASVTVPQRLTQLTADAQKLRDHTGRMERALSREETMGGSQSVEGSQIYVALTQANISESNYMTRVVDHFNDVEGSGIPVLLQHMRSTDETCRGLEATNTTRAQLTDTSEEFNACEALGSAIPKLTTEVNQLESGYKDLFAVWSAENQKQREIITQSSR